MELKPPLKTYLTLLKQIRDTNQCFGMRTETCQVGTDVACQICKTQVTRPGSDWIKDFL